MTLPRELTRPEIIEALKRAGSIRRAVPLLSTSFGGLYRAMRRLDIDPYLYVTSRPVGTAGDGEERRRSRAECERRARVITRFWARRGHDVKVEIVQGEFSPAMRCAPYELNTDMINGLPRELAEGSE